MASWLDNNVKYVAGVGEARAKLLEKELGILSIGDLLRHYPFRYIDRTRIFRIDEIGDSTSAAYVQIRAKIVGKKSVGEGRKSRFLVFVSDGSGSAELIWFKGIKWVENRLEVGREYIIFGRPSLFKGRISLVHPEIEPVEQALSRKEESGFQGIYSTTEKLVIAIWIIAFYPNNNREFIFAFRSKISNSF